MSLKKVWVGGLGMFLWLLSGMAWGGGLILYEVNSPSTGTASAGWAALAADASTAFQNPAGMTRLDRSQLLVGVQPLIITSRFASSPNTSVERGGDDGGNAGSVMPSLGGYYVYSVSDCFKLGLSAVSYFGLGINYGESWVGRYRVEQGTFLSASLVPAAAYRISDWLSVGAMLNIMPSYMKMQTAINNLGGPDGQVTFKDTYPGIGGGLGFLIEPNDRTRIGITYYSPVSLRFKDTPSFSNLGPVFDRLLIGRQMEMKYTVPQWVMVSGYYQVTEQFALMANFGWQDWSQFGNVDLSLQVRPGWEANLATNMHYRDTWHGALGVQYRIAQPWLLSLGFAYDSSPVDTANRSPALPMDRTWRCAAGVQYAWSQNLTLGLAYEYINLGSAEINKQGDPVIGTLAGDYNPNMINVVNLNVIYKF